MSRQDFTIRLKPVRLADIQLSIHESAVDAYEAWRKYGMEDYARLHDHIFDDDALSDALQLASLPVIEGNPEIRPRLYEVIGRFHTFTQIDALRPKTVSLVVLEPGDETPWDDSRLRSLAQAMLVLDACGREEAVPEFRAIYRAIDRATKDKAWLAVKPSRRSRERLAQFAGCSMDQLRERPDPDEEPAIRDMLDDG